MRITTRYACAAAALACCCLPLAACGTERAGGAAAGAGTVATAGARAADGTDGADDPEGSEGADASDTTSDDQGQLPDTTTDDQHTDLPDTTSDDQGELPDTTTDDQQGPDGPYTDGTTDDTSADARDESVPTTGPHRWFPMLREFRAYLRTGAPKKSDAALAAHVTSVRTRTLAGGDRVVAVVRADYGVWETDELDRTAEVFAHWRTSVYGDHGHVDVLAPAKMTAGKDW
ncbi:hypothetical protein [Streptomyces sp. NPDC093260]|uniref:hypothetical protein n=1 Tax=Streptomyces sp. NPDC093260 TaxID=3155073 RepID=UPI0034338046